MTVFFWCKGCAARGVLVSAVDGLRVKVLQGNGFDVLAGLISRAVAVARWWQGFRCSEAGLTMWKMGVRMNEGRVAAQLHLENSIDKRFQAPAIATLLNPF